MNTLRPNMVEPAGVEPAMHRGGGFTVHWGYQFSYDSKILATGRGSVGPSFKSTHGIDCDSPIKLGDAWENRTPVSG